MFLLTSVIAQAQQESPFWFSTGLPFLFIILIFYFVMIRPQQKQQRSHQDLIDNIKKGDKIVTTGGIWGEVDSLDPLTVRLKVGDKNKIVVGRANISGFQPKPGEPAETK